MLFIDVQKSAFFSQEKKRQIVASAFGEQEGGATSRLSMEDISFLFQGG
jgi:hypothetical protein